VSKSEFSLIVRADCEATGHAVADAKLGERATSGLVEITTKAGLSATLLVIPTDLEASSSLYRQIAESGHEVGLHVHPAEQGYEEFLGVYGPDEQRKIIDEAADRFAQVMGRRPLSICIGYGSANDHTYPVFVELGFTHGHISIPTRILPECASVWAGAPLDAHYAHAWNRVLRGSLDFVEIPQTLDPDSRMWGGKHPQDLRVELVDAKNHWYTTAKAVDRQIREQVPVKCIHIVTHNIFEFDDPGDFRRQTLETMIRHAKEIVASKDGTTKGATMAGYAAEFRSVCPLKKTGNQRLLLDTRGRS
jgi:peptidoglycan/xylan/chitin deacetylase (PgdA/CDA1 family)